MTEGASVTLELDDIQSGALRPRPAPYAATYVVLRIDNPIAGSALMRKLSTVVASAAHPESPVSDIWVSAALTFEELKALGVPQASLDSFGWEFKQGMAARAEALGDIGVSSPETWEQPLGTPQVHVILAAVHLEQVVERARQTYEAMGGITSLWRQNCHALPGETEPFGFRDVISHPAIEGSGIPGSNPRERPLKPGEFVLGYPDEMGPAPPIPQPDVLGRNGSYIVFRKLRVAAFRRYIKENAAMPELEELLAAKMMGRWRSVAPLALCPFHDDPGLGVDRACNNVFLYKEDDPIGFKTPIGSHVRRSNPRDADVAGIVSLHRMIRRGTAYGPQLPEGVLEDDGADRGLVFAFVGAHLGRQFEFVQSEWINGGEFLGLGGFKDPVAGDNDGSGGYSIPVRPVPRRLKGLPQFVVMRGGEYGFLPSLSALRWLGELNR